MEVDDAEHRVTIVCREGPEAGVSPSAILVGINISKRKVPEAGVPPRQSLQESIA